MSRDINNGCSNTKSGARSFVESEDGGATIWCLSWLIGLGIMAGLSIDATNAWRHQTILQSTTDAAALAAAWELPENYLEEPYVAGGYTELENAALNYAGFNMTANDYGPYFSRNDIVVGNWDKDTRAFTPGAAFASPDELPVNAVQVQMEETTFRGNGVPTALLHIIGLGAWDVRTNATAIYGTPSCLTNGIIGREGVDLASNTTVTKNACIHGQLVANVNNNVYWENKKSLSAGRSPQGGWQVGEQQYDMDGNLIDMTEPYRQNLYPPMVDKIPSIGRAMLRGDEHFRHFVYPALDPDTTTPPTVIKLPSAFQEVTGTVTSGESTSLPQFGGVRYAGLIDIGDGEPTPTYNDATVDGRTTTFYEVEQQGQQYEWPIDDPTLNPSEHGFTTTTEGAPTAKVTPLTEHRIYFADSCKGGGEGTLKLSGVVRNITLITTCTIDIANGAKIENAVLLSTAGSAGQNTKSIEIGNSAQIGANTACEGWGGVRIYANGMITTPSSGNNESSFRQWYGAHLVARTSVQFAGLSDSTKGLSVYAGGEVKIASNAGIGALEGTLDETYPVGGCPEDGVGHIASFEAHVPILVD